MLAEQFYGYTPVLILKFKFLLLNVHITVFCYPEK